MDEGKIKRISLQNFLVKYGILFIVLIEFVVLALKIFDVLILQMVAPMLLAKVSSLILLKNKVIYVPDKMVKKKFLLTNIIVGVITYFMNYYFYILVFGVYMISVLLGYIISVKSLKNKTTDNITETSIENTQEISSVNAYDEKNTQGIINSNLAKFNDENIIEFLSANNLNYENYFYAMAMPGTEAYILYGSMGRNATNKLYHSF